MTQTLPETGIRPLVELPSNQENKEFLLHMVPGIKKHWLSPPNPILCYIVKSSYLNIHTFVFSG